MRTAPTSPIKPVKGVYDAVPFKGRNKPAKFTGWNPRNARQLTGPCVVHTYK